MVVKETGVDPCRAKDVLYHRRDSIVDPVRTNEGQPSVPETLLYVYDTTVREKVNRLTPTVQNLHMYSPTPCL